MSAARNPTERNAFLEQFSAESAGMGKPAPTMEWAMRIVESLSPCRFDPANPPPAIDPVISLRGTPIVTAGNIALLSGQAGSAKSQSFAALLASALAPGGNEVDSLGWSMPNGHGKAVIYLDFEQSQRDFHTLLEGAMRRAGVAALPPWFSALHLTGRDPLVGCDALLALLWSSRERFGGTLAVLLDGLADLCHSPNDEGEAFALVRRVHGWADEFGCAVLSILHRNAGSDSLKMRGHLGSQAERKAETVLTARRSDEIITVYTTKTRHRPIPERDGARFRWDDKVGMFVTEEAATTVKSNRKAEERKVLGDAIFDGQAPGLTHAEVVARIVKLENVKTDAAKKRLAVLRDKGFIHTTATGLYCRQDENC
ncbi:MAG: AAA family ATPase [Opitutales bacterium]|nr:AAA family ATPase [Opitutales bacterium]